VSEHEFMVFYSYFLSHVQLMWCAYCEQRSNDNETT